MAPKWVQQVLEDHPKLRRATPAQIDAVFASRNISDEVRYGRKYVAYTAGDVDKVLSADPRLRDHRDWVEKVVSQRPGLVMQKRTWHEGRPGRRLVAQLRPFRYKELGLPEAQVAEEYGLGEGWKDEGVWTRDDYHQHDAEMHVHMPETHSFQAVNRDARARQRVTKDDDVIDMEKWLAWSRRQTNPHRRAEAEQRRQDPWDKDPAYVYWRHLETQHEGEDTFSAHPHARDYRAHLWQEHGGRSPGTGPDGLPLRHNHPRFAKYVYAPSEDPSLLDVHPLAWERLYQGGDVVYFCLEGCLKVDAVLSTGAAAVAVGSVAQWRDPLLEAFAAKYFSRFDLVAVVPDSDCLGTPTGNDMVAGQAFALMRTLERYGLNAVVAAPPANRHCGSSTGVCDHLTRDLGNGTRLPAEGHKNGADDALGPEEGHTMDDFIIADNDDPADEPDIMRRARENVEREEELFRYVQSIASGAGRAFFTYRQAAESLGYGAKSWSAVGRVLLRLEQKGLIERLDSRDWLPYQPANREALTAVQILDKRYWPVLRYTRLGDRLRGRE